MTSCSTLQCHGSVIGRIAVTLATPRQIQPIYTSIRFWLLILWIATVNLASASTETPISQAVQKSESPAETLRGEIRVSRDFYPKVYSRGPEYGGIHCFAMPLSNIVKELYLLETELREMPVGQKNKVSVSEFFSGKKYQAQVVNEGSYQVRLIREATSIPLQCEVGKMVRISGKSASFNAQGDYIEDEAVDASSGKWGPEVYSGNNNCMVDGGRADCDMGLHGMSRRRSDGSVVWARLLVAARLYPGGEGHPVWGLPDAIEVRDANWHGTWLDDGTAIFTMDFSGSSADYGPTVRVDMSTGELMDKRSDVARSDVAMVPLDDWTALKHALWERWVGKSYPCGFLGSANEVECRYKLTELYFYTQQNYLFPMFTAPSQK